MKLTYLGASIVGAASVIALGPLACAEAVSLTPPSGGAGGGAATTTGAAGDGGAATVTSGSAGAGGSGGCLVADDCVAFTDACNDGACVNGACAQLPANDLGPCDDGISCTENESCQGGACVPGGMKFCPASDTCHIATCDPVTDSCVQEPGNDGAGCVDTDPCTLTATCSGGACVPGQPVDCSFLDDTCSIGVCDPVIGCTIMPANNGTPCDDGLYCTISDTCNGGMCGGAPNTCAPPGDVCLIGTCDEAADTCIAVPGNNGGACNDGNLCTSGETCSNGDCLGGAPANNGVVCDDGNGCTGGTTCQAGTCTNATSQIIACIDGDTCCPAGCATDTDCLYWVSGVQQNVPATSLTGWSACHTDLYNNYDTPMSQILMQCDKAKLLLACRPVGSPTFTTLAMAPRADVLFDCGFEQNCTNVANGVGWYYSDEYSWGYAPGGENVSRNSCDTELTMNGDRLCWHSSVGFINGGWRCGAATGLNDDPGWERVVFEAD
jgi:hypothetical protein